MSWTNFKNRILLNMQTNAFGKDIDGFAKEFTSAYDIAIKSGFDIIHNVSVVKGNTDLMETTLIGLMKQTQLSKNKSLLEVIGPAIISYWIDVEFSKIPPVIPAIGAIKNLVGIDGYVISTGQWTPLPVLPNNDSNIFLDSFINSAKLHLSTLSGIYVVLAQYTPPTPPAPAIINWTGYNVVG